MCFRWHLRSERRVRTLKMPLRADLYTWGDIRRAIERSCVLGGSKNPKMRVFETLACQDPDAKGRMLDDNDVVFTCPVYVVRRRPVYASERPHPPPSQRRGGPCGKAPELPSRTGSAYYAQMCKMAESVSRAMATSSS